MELNANFHQIAVQHDDQHEWTPSPIPGVDRKMLDRIGDEVARATTIVRYAPESHFDAHTHGGGEEFLVLDGVFQDEHGDFPAGTYVRNPPTSSHTPGSKEGCTIFVKLRQFAPEDRTHVVIDSNKSHFVNDASRPGVAVLPLFRDPRETVALEQWEAGAEIPLDTRGGAEILVLEGTATVGGEELRERSWIRLPIGAEAIAVAGDEGAKVWTKRDHLPYALATLSEARGQ